MRRPHRTIETFDISLMAVVTKAMGAFLVLMLLLLPYYTPEPRESDAAELLRQLKAMNARLDEVAKQLGDTNKGPAELRQDLGKLSVDATMRTEVIAKLEGLINKAFSEVRRLEAEVARLDQENHRLKDENERLVAENRSLKDENDRLNSELDRVTAENQALRDEIASLRNRIAELEAELERLRKLRPDEEEYRVVTASYAATGCNSIALDGTILKVGQGDGYTWNADGSRIAPQWLLNVDFEEEGGQAPIDEARITYSDNSGFLRYQPRGNAGTLVKWNVGDGDYIIGFTKKDRERRWQAEGKTWRMLRASGDYCDVEVSTAVRLAKKDAWIGQTPFAIRMRSNVIGGVLLAFTSNNDGITFRSPSEAEQKWFDHLIEISLKYQEEIPAHRQEREEESRRKKEEAEERRRETEERRRKAREEADQRKNAPMTQRERESAEQRIKGIERRIKSLPPGSMRDSLESHLKSLKEELARRGQTDEAEDGTGRGNDPIEELRQTKKRLEERIEGMPEGSTERKSLERMLERADERLKTMQRSGPDQ